MAKAAYNDGQHYTSQETASRLAKAIIDYMDPMLVLDGGRVLEPAVGQGSLIAELIYQCQLHNKDFTKTLQTVDMYDINRDTSGVIDNYTRSKQHTCRYHVEDFLKAEPPEKEYDIVIANPPFLGGLKISGNLGDDYKKFLKKRWPGPVADLSAYFVRRCAELLSPKGVMGFITTNTIAQGATRVTGLKWLLANGYEICWAVPNFVWDGDAVVHCSMFVMRRKTGDSAP